MATDRSLTGVQGCALRPDYATAGGFCTCQGDWIADGAGECIRPCWRDGQQDGTALVSPAANSGIDECWLSGSDATADTDLPDGCITSDATGATWNDAAYYCICDSTNGWT